MASSERKGTISQAVGKVVFYNLNATTGKNYIWIRITRNKVNTLANYWRKNKMFHYMKIYKFDRKSREVGEQIGFITHRVATLEIDPQLLWKRSFNQETKRWEY